MSVFESKASLDTLVLLAQMVHKVFQAFQDRCLQLMASSSRDTARPRMYHTVPMGLISSTMDILCFMCRATKGHTDRTWVRRVFISPACFVTPKSHCYVANHNLDIKKLRSQTDSLCFRYGRQLSAQVQHHAFHVLQHKQRLQLRLPQRLLLLAVHAGTDAHVHGPHHWREHQALHQQVA